MYPWTCPSCGTMFETQPLESVGVPSKPCPRCQLLKQQVRLQEEQLRHQQRQAEAASAERDREQRYARRREALEEGRTSDSPIFEKKNPVGLAISAFIFYFIFLWVIYFGARIMGQSVDASTWIGRIGAGLITVAIIIGNLKGRGFTMLLTLAIVGLAINQVTVFLGSSNQPSQSPQTRPSPQTTNSSKASEPDTAKQVERVSLQQFIEFREAALGKKIVWKDVEPLLGTQKKLTDVGSGNGVTWRWDYPDGSYVICTFKDSILTNATQNGLK